MDENNNINFGPLNEAPVSANLPADSTVPADIVGNNAGFKFPTAPVQQTPDISSIPTFESILGQTTQEEQQVEQQGQDISGRIEGLLGKLRGKETEQIAAEEQAGLPGFEKDLVDVNAQIQALQKESLAIPMQLQEQFKGRGVTEAGLAPIEASALRKNAIQALGLSAISQTLQGNVALAQQQADKAIEAEFAPIEAELEYQRELYDMNKDVLDRLDSKKAETLKLQLNERARLLEDQKADKKEVYNTGLLARKYGADTATVQNIFNAKTTEEAVTLAGQYLQDPAAKLEMSSLLLSNQSKRLDIIRKQKEIEIFDKYGGLTEAQYRKQLEEETKGMEQAQEDAIILDNSINQIGAILDSPALDSVVGPNIFARGTARQKGFFSGAASFITSLGISGTGSEITGKADDTVALTQQILDQQFLDKLIAVKSKGATFGALSDNEGAALRNAANAIANTAIKRDERVIGYDMSEKEFTAQMKTIQELMQRSYQNATGNTFTADEQALFDNMEKTLEEAAFNPAY